MTKSANTQKCAPNISISQRNLERIIDLDEIATASSSEKISTGCDENKKFLIEVLRQLRIVKENNIHLIRLFVDREELNQVTTGEVKRINNFEDLSKSNDDLSDKTKFAEMYSMLQYIGGKDDNEICSKILCNLITNELAIQTNWTGRNEKNGFRDLKNLIQMIHVSVRKNPLPKYCTINNVKTTIKAWLRTTGDCEGGRAKRNAQK